MKSVNDFLS